jgi:hypothetical protein
LLFLVAESRGSSVILTLQLPLGFRIPVVGSMVYRSGAVVLSLKQTILTPSFESFNSVEIGAPNDPKNKTTLF